MVPDSVVGKIQYDTMHDEIDRMNLGSLRDFRLGLGFLAVLR